MNNIAIDITHFDKLSGFGVVTRNIIKWLLEEQDGNFYYLFSNEEKNLDSLNEYKNFKFIKINDWFIKYKFFSLAKYLRQYKIDIFFSLDQTLPFKKVCKYIMIEHDIWMQRLWKKLDLLKLFLKKDFLWLYHLLDIEKYHLKKADIIITPTNYVKNDIIDYYGLDKNKIKVINWWLDHLEKASEEINKENYILFPYLNESSWFAEKLAEKILEKKLVDKIIFLRYFKKIENPNIINVDKKIQAEENKEFYSKAKITIYLSSNDWFWIVPLESMHYWTPVIFNKNTCLDEVSWNGGIEIDKLNLDDFIFEIEKILKNPEVYNNQINNGYQWIKKYKWENTVKKIIDLF